MRLFKTLPLLSFALTVFSCHNPKKLHETLIGNWEPHPNPSELIVEFREDKVLLYGARHKEESKEEYDYEIIESESRRIVISIITENGTIVGNSEVLFYPSPDSITIQGIDETPNQNHTPSTLYRADSSLPSRNKQESGIKIGNAKYVIEYHLEGRVKSVKMEPDALPFNITVQSCSEYLLDQKIYLVPIDTNCVRIDVPGSDKPQDTICFDESHNSKPLHLDLKRNNDRIFESIGGRFFIVIKKV